MLKYFKMKRNEIKVKSMFYETVVVFFDNQKEIVELLTKLYSALKDVPAEDLKNEFIEHLAEIIHEEGKMENK